MCTVEDICCQARSADIPFDSFSVASKLHVRVCCLDTPVPGHAENWALPPAGGPKSLGVLGREKVLRLTAGEGDVREGPTLAISLEPKGGVPSAPGPTGPVLFKGALIQMML